jgi:hypothetical protein
MKKKNSGKNKKKKTARIPRPRPFLMDVQAPAAYGAVQHRGSSTLYPTLMQQGGRMFVKNYELISALTAGNGAFQLQSFTTNPGIPSSFPWLTSVAQGFQKFKWHYLRYFFSGSCSTTTAGKVYVEVSYDYLDTTPSSLAQVMASDTASSGPAWFGGAISKEKAFDPRLNGDANIFVDVDCAKFTHPYYYVRSTSVSSSNGGSLTGAPTGGIGTLAFVPGTSVESSAEPAVIYTGGSGVTNGTAPGELYAAYVIEFFEPVAPATAI